jgi:hypothetical protein
MTLRSIALATAVLAGVAAAPLPALALQDRSKCTEAKAAANAFDIKTFCPRSDWPETYTAAEAKKAVTAPIRAFMSVFK